MISVGIGALPLQDESKIKLLSLLESARIASNKESASYWKSGVADFIIQFPSEKLEYYWHGCAIFTGTRLYISEDAGRLWEQLIASEMPDQDNAKFKTSPNDIIKNFNI